MFIGSSDWTNTECTECASVSCFCLRRVLTFLPGKLRFPALWPQRELSQVGLLPGVWRAAHFALQYLADALIRLHSVCWSKQVLPTFARVQSYRRLQRCTKIRLHFPLSWRQRSQAALHVCIFACACVDHVCTIIYKQKLEGFSVFHKVKEDSPLKCLAAYTSDSVTYTCV